MPKTSGTTERITASQAIQNFLQKYARTILIVIGAFVAVIVIAGVALAILDSNRIRNIAAVEKLVNEVAELQYAAEADKDAAYARILAEAEPYTKKYGAFPRSRAWGLIASLHGERKEWKEAEAAYLSAAAANPTSYQAPVAIFNAAVSAEEQGNPGRALDLYRKISVEYDEFLQLPRVYFSIGRILEGQKDTESAVIAYQKIVDTWPEDGLVSLAQARLIILDTTSAN